MFQTVVLSKSYSNYAASPYVHRIKEEYDYDVVRNAPEWTYVTRLMPFETIPAISSKEKYPSGWIPPREEAKQLPFFIARTKNHNVPIYLNVFYRIDKKISKIKRIEGDIWALNDEIKFYLKEKHGKYIESRVHEMARFIEVKGDYVLNLRAWAYSKGF